MGIKQSELPEIFMFLMTVHFSMIYEIDIIKTALT